MSLPAVAWAVIAPGGGVPWEIWALFRREYDARTHAERSAYVFSVEPIAVHARFGDIPVDGASVDEAEYVREVLAAGPAPTPDVVYGIGSDNVSEPEYTALYLHREDAERHGAASYYACQVEELRVHRSYAACPTAERYLQGGQMLSQLVVRKP